MKAGIRGVSDHMKQFDFFYGACLGAKLLRHADNLSTMLQTKELSAADAQRLAKQTVATFENMRSDNEFDFF